VYARTRMPRPAERWGANDAAGSGRGRSAEALGRSPAVAVAAHCAPPPRTR